MKRTTLAIPLRCTDYSNSSQVVALLSEEAGLLEGIAKGAYRPKASFQSPFDLAVLYDVVFIERKSSSLSLFAESTVVDGFRSLRKSWARHVAASHVLEFSRTVATQGEESRGLFHLVRRTFELLANACDGDVETLLLEFDLAALRLSGLLPTMDVCVRCGRVWPPSRHAVFFSAQAGGLICRACRPEMARYSGRDVPGNAIRVLQGLVRMPEVRGRSDELQRDLERHRSVVVRSVGDLRNHLLERQFTVLKSSFKAGLWLGDRRRVRRRRTGGKLVKHER